MIAVKYLYQYYLIVIFLVDHSRVILKGRDPDVIGSDYINANYLDVSQLTFDLGLGRHYLLDLLGGSLHTIDCTQATGGVSC